MPSQGSKSRILSRLRTAFKTRKQRSFNSLRNKLASNKSVANLMRANETRRGAKPPLAPRRARPAIPNGPGEYVPLREQSRPTLAPGWTHSKMSQKVRSKFGVNVQILDFDRFHDLPLDEQHVYLDKLYSLGYTAEDVLAAYL